MIYIRDQLYDYIPVSPLESELLKRPEVLRLHRILQNSTLFITYPCNRASRFSHSLGVMHVAGMMFKSLIHNSHTDFIKELHKTVREFIRAMTPLGWDELADSRKYLINAYNTADGVGEFFLTQGWSMGGELQDENGNAMTHFESDEDEEFQYYYNTVNNIVFQAIRLAALAHDIGHLPFSHVLEYSLGDLASQTLILAKNSEIYRSAGKLTELYLDVIAKRTIGRDATFADAQKAGIRKGELHEMIGIILLSEIPKNIRGKLALEDTFWRACIQTAIRIISVDQLGHFYSDNFKARIKDKNFQQLKWYVLGNIINGQVDCDRLDYVRRDPINAGAADIGNFDFSRVVTNIKPIRLNLKSDLKFNVDDHFYVPGFDRRALSALTDYFHQRMRLYRWLINHHNVVRTDLALGRLIIKLADIFENEPETIIGRYLKEHDFNKLWDWSQIVKNYRYIDDAWLDTLLQGLYEKISSNKGSQEAHECQLFLEVLYDRKLENMRPIWKRIDGFMPFAAGFKNEFIRRHQDKPLNFIERNPYLNHLDFSDSSEAASIQLTNLILSFWKKSREIPSPYTLMEPIERKLAPNLNVVFAFKTVTPYKPVFVALDDNEKIELKNISSLIAKMNEIHDGELKLYAFEIPSFGATHDRRWDLSSRRDFGKKVGQALYETISEEESGNGSKSS